MFVLNYLHVLKNHADSFRKRRTSFPEYISIDQAGYLKYTRTPYAVTTDINA